MRKIFKSFILNLALATSALPTIAMAQPAGPRSIPCVPGLPCIQPETQQSKQAVQDFVINTFAVNFIQGFLGIVAIAAVIFIIIGGIQMHVAVGNEEALGKAKKTVGWAIGGLVIAMLAYYIVAIISNLPLS
ncbi:hypothetical protein COV82_05595 [Candidatus Peregrinibacteria bacterium CG11_big_fil_rev_8_21_14_0_20_46_8]|nr:MAG: hypothetical protein COV82_05595 [Candidatus Peregrinibacteria bacterium CG11_big_fil_rev_8_21_14_0_20_46_8]